MTMDPWEERGLLFLILGTVNDGWFAALICLVAAACFIIAIVEGRRD